MGAGTVGTTVKSNLVIPEVLLDAVEFAFVGMIALMGTGAAIVAPGLPQMGEGTEIKIPYFEELGDFDDPGENDALLPVRLDMTSEVAPIQRSGKAWEATKWAQMAAMYADPYKEAARQLREGAIRRYDKALIDAAKAANTALELDVYSATQKRLLDYDLMSDAKGLFGDERENIALLVVHSNVMTDLEKLKDADGRPLLTQPEEGKVQRFAGVPVKPSDRLAPSSDSPKKYTSLLLKRGALALWYDGIPSVETDKDILRDARIAAVNTYFAAHAYKRSRGNSKSGIVRIKHNASKD